MRNHIATLCLLAIFPCLCFGWNAPSYSGFNLIWQDTFAGPAGSAPDPGVWNVITNLHVNNEVETYTASSTNLQISGGNTLQIVPVRDASGAWTSARIESSYTFSPNPGSVTFAEADIRFGSSPDKQGIWPAFWILGNSIRHGTPWPECGEVDVMEMVDGRLTGYGTVHCDHSPGGLCNEPSGIQVSTGIPDFGWHTWRVQWDRSPNQWQSETITWFCDGSPLGSVIGSGIGDEATWANLAHSPLFFILNVAVGGDWPGGPNGNTESGFGNMMEIAYVALYSN